MRRFELVEPASFEEACSLLSERENARAIAGGTALLILIKQGLYVPGLLINLKKLRGADGITYDPVHGLRIEALASILDVETSTPVRQHYPLLADATHVVANIRIRNMASMGGNLAHADYQSDPPAALVALGAELELTSTEGRRKVALSEFLIGPYETALHEGELVSSILVPPSPSGCAGVYLKFVTGSSEERPCAGIAVFGRLQMGICEEVRVVVGAVSGAPVRVYRAEECAMGEKLTPHIIDQVAREASRAVEPISDVRGSADYKRHIVGVLTKRALARLRKEQEQ